MPDSAVLETQVAPIFALKSPRRSIIDLVRGPIRFEGWCGTFNGKSADAILVKIGNRCMRCRRLPANNPATGVPGVHFLREFTTSGGFKWIRLFVAYGTTEIPLWSGLIYNCYPGARAVPADLSEGVDTQVAIQARRAGGGRIAVVLHLYYEDLWAELFAALSRIPEAFDLYVTVRDNSSSALVMAIKDVFPDAVLIPVDNRGRDILPFLCAMARIDRSKYEYVCKVHSKKAPHRADGERWRAELLHDLLGGSEIIRHMLAHFDANPRLGLVAPWDNLTAYSALPGDSVSQVAELKRRMGAEWPIDFPFPKGSMFWARMAAMEPLMSADIRSDEFALEAGQMDGTMAHAVERVFGLSALYAGFTCEEAPEIFLS
jgi:hypothetical protein